MTPSIQAKIGRGPWPAWQWEVFVKSPGYAYAIVMRGTARTAQAARDAVAEAMPRVKAALAAMQAAPNDDAGGRAGRPLHKALDTRYQLCYTLTMSTPPRYLTFSRAARELDLSISYIRKLVDAGKLVDATDEVAGSPRLVTTASVRKLKAKRAREEARSR